MCSYLGYGITEPAPGDDVNKIDATITAQFKDSWAIHTPKIDVQAKTTVESDIKKDFIPYRIDKNTLHYLKNTSTEHLLVLLVISDNPDHRVMNTDKGLLLEKKMYWFNPRKSNIDCEGETVTIHIPTKNVLTIETLHRMIDIVGNGGEIGYEL